MNSLSDLTLDIAQLRGKLDTLEDMILWECPPGLIQQQMKELVLKTQSLNSMIHHKMNINQYHQTLNRLVRDA
jgi:hypothetical protein